MEVVWSSFSLVYLAALIQIVGFLIRDQLVLRSMILIGTALYIVYYFIEPAVPLWDAMACGALMGLANAYTMMRIVADRRPGAFDEEDLLIYGAIRHIAPGEFKRLMKRAEKSTVTTDTVLTEEGIAPEHLYFVTGGELEMRKRGEARRIHVPCFIGEIGYLLNQPASATVTLHAGGRYARWRASELRALVDKQEKVQAALEIAFNRDLAKKVAAA